MESKIHKNFIQFFSLGLLIISYTGTLLYLACPEKFQKVYQIYHILENSNCKNPLILLPVLFSLPIIYTFGAFAFYYGEEIIDRYLNKIPYKQLIKEIQLKNFSARIENDIRISDLIYTSEENNWIKNSRRFYEYSNFFAGVFGAIIVGIVPLISFPMVEYIFSEETSIESFIKSMVPMLLVIAFYYLPLNLYFTWNMKKGLLRRTARFLINPIITSLFFTSLLGITLHIFGLKISYILPILLFTMLVLIFSSGVSISSKQKGNFFLILGAESNKFLKSKSYLSDNGNGQHLYSPQDSSTKPQ